VYGLWALLDASGISFHKWPSGQPIESNGIYRADSTDLKHLVATLDDVEKWRVVVAQGQPRRSFPYLQSCYQGSPSEGTQARIRPLGKSGFTIIRGGGMVLAVGSGKIFHHSSSGREIRNKSPHPRNE